MRKRGTLRLLIVLMFFSVSAGAQVVWPGDVNNNGVVNGVDVLYLGLAYGRTGPERDGGNRNWEAQAITALWGGTFPGGPDYAYADCNGDGEVDEKDLDDVIKQNFGLTHGVLTGDGFSNGAGGMDPPLLLQPEEAVVNSGAAFNISLRLGTEVFPVANFYGVALKMSYSAGIVNQNAIEEGLDFDLNENNWLEGGNGETVDYLFRKEHATGKAELAITRLDQRMIELGQGVIGQFSVVVEDIIVGSESDTFTIQIDSVFFIDDQLNIYPLVTDKAQVIISNDMASATGSRELPVPVNLQIYPNPAREYLLIEADREIEYVRVFDATGRPFPLPGPADNRSSRRLIPTGAWPPGFYFLEARLARQTILQKFVVLSDGS